MDQTLSGFSIIFQTGVTISENTRSLSDPEILFRNPRNLIYDSLSFACRSNSGSDVHTLIELPLISPKR
jgi:hypothetical protein